VAEQNGVCAICREPETKVLYGRTCKLAIDHDHTTGKVRGLVCSRCNSILGMAQDDAALLLNALGYLSKHRSGPVQWEKPGERLTA
jgi:hypothetical protein